jgi:AcrR family transcriptional regulator
MSDLAVRDGAGAHVAGDPANPSSDDTGARLVAAAAEVFAEKGYDGAGVAEIARRAGLTTGAIYSRYSGKAELLAEAIRSTMADEFDVLFAQHRFQGRAADLLETVGSHLIARSPGPERALLVEAFVASRRDAEVAEVMRQHLAERAERLGGVIDASKAVGLVDPTIDTAAVVHFAHAVGLGFLLYEAVDVTHPDPAAWDDVIHRVVRSGVAPSDPSATSHPPSTSTITDQHEGDTP